MSPDPGPARSVAYLRQLRAYEGEVVEIKWTCADGSTFYQRVEIPPKTTRDARMQDLA